MGASRIRASIDLNADGRQIGDLMLPWSDNTIPLGYHPIPIISVKGSAGPTVLIIGGTHGDEFEGPAAIMRLVDTLRPSDVTGQILFIPGLNQTAVQGVCPGLAAGWNKPQPRLSG